MRFIQLVSGEQRERESGDVIEGPMVGRGGRGGAGGPDQEYSKRENAARPACRDFTYLTRNLHRRAPTHYRRYLLCARSRIASARLAVIARNIEDNTFLV